MKFVAQDDLAGAGSGLSAAYPRFMTGLEELKALLDGLPWSERCRLEVREEPGRLLLRRKAVHASARDRGDGLLEVAYEPELHQVAREILPPAAALERLLTVLHGSEP